MRIDDLDYHLPPELIAQEPAKHRAGSRMLVIHRHSGRIEHRTFSDIVEYLHSPDVLVVNNTKVVPCRLIAVRESTGGIVEVFVLEERGGGMVRAMTGSKGKLVAGERLLIRPSEDATTGMLLVLTLGAKRADGTWDIRIEHGPASANTQAPVEAVMRDAALMPLPPYIKRARSGDAHAPEDRERYQTVYAKVEGAVAAPTAGLHFTPDLLESLRSKGVGRAELTLHVGIGTFRPVKADSLDAHDMHSEDYDLPASTATTIGDAKRSGGRIVSVGTTTTRVLESCALATIDRDASASVSLRPGRGATKLLIQPGHRWQVVDALITNFHLPRSTLLALVMAFAGIDLTREAYRQAVAERYRFFSYGDAMLIV